MNELTQRLDKLRDMIRSPEFQSGKGLGNEVNIWMFCYDIKDEQTIHHFTEQIKTDQALNCHLVISDLYQVFLSLLDEDNLEAIDELVEDGGEKYLHEALTELLAPQTFAESILAELDAENTVLMLTGVGDVFPFMRVHALLNALQVDNKNYVEFPEIPIIVMYPGEFNGRQLQLFGRLKPNEFYRAFNAIQGGTYI